MPKARFAELKSFLSRTKYMLEAQGCELLMATTLRSPVSRSLSDSIFHSLTSPEEIRSYSALESNYQVKYLMDNYVWYGKACAPDML